MQAKVLFKIGLIAIVVIIASLMIFFYQDLHKQYYSLELGLLTKALKMSLKNQSPMNQQYVINNALPVLNKTKMNFLKYAGYWPLIFNGYNQAAYIEYLNRDKKAAVKLLLRSVHFHPNLAETYRALSKYLAQAGLVDGAIKCQSYYHSLIEGSGIDPEDQKTCLKLALRFCLN